MGARRFVAVALAACVVTAPSLIAQAPGAPAPAVTMSPAQIKQEVDKIKKGRTLLLVPALGTDDPAGATTIRLDNTSPFDLVILLVGPSAQRVELGPNRMQTLTIEPGDYEVALTVVGRNLPPFFGKETITPKMQFRHQFVIPAV
jgi:hypothetical protein